MKFEREKGRLRYSIWFELVVFSIDTIDVFQGSKTNVSMSIGALKSLFSSEDSYERVIDIFRALIFFHEYGSEVKILKNQGIGWHVPCERGEGMGDS